MSTPKPLYAHERVMYHPALLTCPHGGDLLVMCNSLAWEWIGRIKACAAPRRAPPSVPPHAAPAGGSLGALSSPFLYES